MRIASLGHAVFAVTLFCFGIIGFVKHSFTVMWEAVPQGLPGRAALAYVCAFVTVVAGAGLLRKRTAAAAARLLLGLLLLWMMAFRLPPLFRSLAVDFYWAACKTAVLLAAAWVLYTWFATEWDREHLGFAAGKAGLFIARALYGAAMIPFGIAHLQFVQFTASLVPSWLPGHVAWTYFTGIAFMVAGVAILAGVWARLAVALSALQMGLFLLLVWVPVVASGKANAFQWNETIVSWLLMAAGCVVADSYRDTPWLAVKAAG